MSDRKALYSQKQLLHYLSSRLSPDVLTALYKGEWAEFACQAIFRALSPQARVYVLRAMAGVAVNDTVLAWKGSKAVHDHALSSLVNLNIFQIANNGGKPGGLSYMLSDAFAKGMKHALCHPPHASAAEESSKQIRERTEERAAEQWNSVLSFLVSSTGNMLSAQGGQTEPVAKKAGRQPQAKRAKITPSSSPVPSQQSLLDPAVQNELKSLGFVAEGEDEEQGNQHITSNGYEFMLKEVFEQVWIMVQHFIAGLAEAEQAPTIRFLFYISFLHPGAKVIFTGNHLPKKVLAFFEALGMISANGNGYNVSSLGIHAMFGPSTQKKLFASSGNSSANNEQPVSTSSSTTPSRSRLFGLSGMRIIVETTFKVFCYTTSPMHAQMLSLFCQIEARLPNLVVAMITRDSVAAAFKKGISDEQLISFLVQNAHPVTYSSRYNIVPDNVTDQIRLWKRETARLTFTYGKLFQLGNQDKLYNELMGNEPLDQFIAWRDDVKRKFFLRSEGDPEPFRSALSAARQALQS